MKKFAIIISSCDKYLSLWQQNINHIIKNWIGDVPDIYIVTDKKTEAKVDGAQIVWFNDNMPARIKKAAHSLKYDYYLITLDDYFLIKPTENDDFTYLINFCSSNNVHYLQLYDRRTKKHKNACINSLKKIDLSKDYAICLYPAIWEKGFIDFCFSLDCSPWEFEPKLTLLAARFEANCFYSNKECFEILDVIRKGKILHKAKKYVDKNKIDIGKWDVVPYSQEFKLFLADRFSWYAPKFLYRLVKGIAHVFGKKFYSDSKNDI